MPPLIMGIILGVYALVVIICAGVGFGLTGDLAEVSRMSLWQCNESNATMFDNKTCTGLDFAEYNTLATVSSPSMSKPQKTLIVSLVLQHVGNWSTVMSTNVSVSMYITGWKGNLTKELVANEPNWTMHVYCPNASEWCNPIVLNHINALKSDVYEMNFSLLRTGKTQPNETRAPWIGDVVVVLESAHVSYTYASMIWGAVVSVILIAALVFFALVCVRVHGWTLQFRWVVILLVACILYNHPLEVLSVYAPGWTFELFEQFCVSSFIVLLCGFWLTLFRAANDKNKKMRYFEGTTQQQKVVKLLFFIVPIVFSTAVTTWQRLHDHDQYDLLKYFGYEVLCSALIVVMCFYIGVTLYALFRVDAEYDPEFMTLENHRRRMIFYVVSFVVLLVTMINYLVEMLHPSSLDHLGRDVFMSVLHSGYVIVMMIFSLPATKRKHYKVDTKNNVITITETDEESTDTQSVDSTTSGAPHSSFSIDFHFARPSISVDGSAPISPSTSFTGIPTSKGPIPVPTDAEAVESDSSEIPTESAADSSDPESEEEAIVVDV